MHCPLLCTYLFSVLMLFRLNAGFVFSHLAGKNCISNFGKLLCVSQNYSIHHHLHHLMAHHLNNDLLQFQVPFLCSLTQTVFLRLSKLLQLKGLSTNDDSCCIAISAGCSSSRRSDARSECISLENLSTSIYKIFFIVCFKRFIPAVFLIKILQKPIDLIGKPNNTIHAVSA